jgi:hypothetical protein
MPALRSQDSIHPPPPLAVVLVETARLTIAQVHELLAGHAQAFSRLDPRTNSSRTSSLIYALVTPSCSRARVFRHLQASSPGRD